MELELCTINYEKLCQTADIEFAYQSTIYDQLKTIAEYRSYSLPLSGITYMRVIFGNDF